MSLSGEFLYWVDSQISVKSLFWSDLRWLAWLPLWPFLLISLIFFEHEAVRQASIIAGFLLCIPWNVLLFRRRRKKKQEWVEPSRFSDENGGY